MSFIREILRMLPQGFGGSDYQAVIIEGAAYFENVKVLKAEPELMVFAAKSRRINITGSGMYINRLDGDTLMLSGKIFTVDLGGSKA